MVMDFNGDGFDDLVADDTIRIYDVAAIRKDGDGSVVGEVAISSPCVRVARSAR